MRDRIDRSGDYIPAAPRANTARRVARVVGAVALLAAVWPAYHLLWRQHVKRFAVVRPGVLYRVAQPSELGIRYLVAHHGVKTVLNLRMEDDQLRRGVLALGRPRGPVESEFVEELGIQHVQWAMGHEACWPWVSPWQFEEFYRLFDEPANYPVAVHCVSGRHRTGTISALFRLEYDRWPIERVLAEMYSFDFGPAVPLQEMNLRTYVPRPLPSEGEWRQLRAAWAPLCQDGPPPDYAVLVRHLRASPDREGVRQKLGEQLRAEAVFALPLAARLIDGPDDPACTDAADAAAACLERTEARFADRLSAAALVADFGTPEQQRRLIELLHTETAQPDVTPRYRAMAAGIANRYTGNRIAFLVALLDDERLVPDSGELPVRYGDLAVVRLSAILDQRLLDADPVPTLAQWQQARVAARAWLAAHPLVAQLSRLQEPTSHAVLR
ncbi:MAG: tyrosine-protein phosphatase [Planctomycetia bacterium]|nr:tyrosine-protein phosphatase [Planctomycetia bacterium]